MMPVRSIRDAIDNPFERMFNIVLGAIFGALLCYFLAFPTYRSTMVDASTQALVAANEEAMADANNISALQSQVAALQTELEGYKGKENLPDSYNSVIEALQAYQQQDMKGAAEKLQSANVDFLEGSGRAAYDTIMSAYNQYHAEELYGEGYQMVRSRNFEGAIGKFTEALAINESCKDGDLLYYLAYCEQQTKRYAEAKAHYQRYMELYPSGRFIKDIKWRLEDVEDKLAEANATGEEGANAGQ